MQLENSKGIDINLQIATLKDVKTSYTSQTPFLIKNITDDNITANVKLVNNTQYIKTVLYPGWNTEICVGIKDIYTGQIQIGY